MVGRIPARSPRALRRLAWSLAVVATAALGGWGFVDLRPGPAGAPPGALSLVDVGYRTLQLFTLNLNVPMDAEAPPQLWVAAFLGALVLASGLAALLSTRISALVTYLSRPSLVVFGASRGATLVGEQAPTVRPWRPVVVVDPDPVALETVVAPRVRTVVGDGAVAAVLTRAAVRRAPAVVVCTGDHARNSSITTAVLAAQDSALVDVYVEVDGPGAADVLEQGGRRAGVETTPFSAGALAVGAVLDRLDSDRQARDLSPLLAVDPDGTPATVALFGRGALVEAMLLELFRRRRRQLLEDPATVGCEPRVLVCGPDARRHHQALTALLGTGLHVLTVEALHTELGQLVELDIDTARRLARHRLRQVFVLVPDDLDSGIAVALGRHLGRASELVLVNESAATPFGDTIAEQAATSPLTAEIRLFRVPELAYRMPVLTAERRAWRLARAMPGGTATATAVVAATAMIGAVEDAGVVVRGDALATLDPPHLPLLAALGLDPLATARAGLTVDFQNPDVLVRAGRNLLTTGSQAAFSTWCEVARLRGAPTALRADAPPESGSGHGPDLDDVRLLLRIRRAALGDDDARRELGPPSTAGTGPAAVIVLCAGPTDDDRIDLLAPTWRRLREHAVWTTAAADSGLVRAAAEHGVPLRTSTGEDSARHRVLAVWREIVADGHDPRETRVVALPDAAIEEVLVARALGARVGRLVAPDAPEDSRLMLGGAARVTPLPDDRMTVRAFLRPSRWPRELADPEPIARELHRRYVLRHRTRKDAGDPALQPWERLSAWLQDSNLAVVDDIPNKLATIGLRLVAPDPWDPEPTVDLEHAVAQDLELLAEQEHGRFTAERLTSGWTDGARDPARLMTPHLIPWAALDDETRDYDREAVRALPGALRRQGLGAVPWS